MVEKKRDNSDTGGDRNVEQIRDILFGGQMRDYERRFLEITQRLEQESQRLRTDLDKRLTALEKRVDEQNDKLAKQLRQEVSDRGKAVDDLDARTLQAARTARNEINTSFDQLRQDLADADERERRAVADLASALAELQRNAEAALNAARGELRGEKVGREDLAALLTEVALRLKGEFDLPVGK